MKNALYPCWILLGNTKEAADFYLNVFQESKMLSDTALVKNIQLFDQQFMLLNEGPKTTPNSSISFMLVSETEEETRLYWDKLSYTGNVLMPLDRYAWSPLYGWVEDQFGISWQIYTGSLQDTPQRISPVLMFTGGQVGKAEAAIHFYTKVFSGSSVQGILKYQKEEDNPDYVKHAQFSIRDYILMAMDSSLDHGFEFNDAISFVAECKDQQEIDYLWDSLTQNGGQEVACGWLIDPFGVRWQIVPENMSELISDPEKGAYAFQAMLKMKKINISDLHKK